MMFLIQCIIVLLFVPHWLQAIQNMGNLGGQLSSAKEIFMKPLHPLILDNVPQVKDFLDQLTDISDTLGKVEFVNL